MFSSADGVFIFSDGTSMNMYNIGTQITLAQAEEILRADIAIREEKLNEALDSKGIRECINQRFYDALFLLTYQVGMDCLTNTSDLSAFLNSDTFDLNNSSEIKEQFGEYTNNLDSGTMKRRTDELDIIFEGDYERGYDETRYGDIWRKKTYPNTTTPGY